MLIANCYPTPKKKFSFAQVKARGSAFMTSSPHLHPAADLSPTL